MVGIAGEIGSGTAARGLPGRAAAMLLSCGGWVVGLECSERWEELEFIAGGGEAYVAPQELSGSRRAMTKGASEGWKCSVITRELLQLADEHMKQRKKKTEARGALWLFAASCPCLLRHLRCRPVPGRGQG